MKRILALTLTLSFAQFACGESAATPDAAGDSGPGVDSGPRVDAGPGFDGGFDAGPGADSGLGLDGGRDARSPDAGPLPEWRLAEGHFYPSVMPMTLVYPRADTETEEHARHRWAHPGVSYRIPAAIVQGGAWPFHYELVAGPPGAEVGAQLVSDGDVQVSRADYGVLRWTPRAEDEGTSFAFHVRVTDQEGTMIDAEWSVTVDSTRFLFLSPSGDASNPGTIDSPMRDVADWYNGDVSDASHAGELVYFRAGNYAPRGDEGSTYVLFRSTKPLTMMAFPGESVTIDTSTTSFGYGEGTHDIFVTGLHFEGSRERRDDGTLIENIRTFGMRQDVHHRVTFFELSVHDQKPGSVGNDNPAFFFAPNSGRGEARRSRYWAFSNNRFEQAGPVTSNGPAAVSISNVSYAVYEGNSVIEWEATSPFIDKSNDDYLTYRNNDLWLSWRAGSGPSSAMIVGLSSSYDPDHIPGYIEIAYNRIRTSAPEGSAGAERRPWALAIGNGGTAPGRNPVWIYRNSIFGRSSFRRPMNYGAVFDRNVLQGDLIGDALGVVAEGDNAWTEDFGAMVFDDEGRLSGRFRDENLGTRGADIY